MEKVGERKEAGGGWKGRLPMATRLPQREELTMTGETLSPTLPSSSTFFDSSRQNKQPFELERAIR